MSAANSTESEILHRSGRTVVSRVLKSDGRWLIAKAPASAFPSSSERAAYRREFNLLQFWQLEGLPKPLELLENDSQIQLVFEDNQAESLATLLDKRHAFTLKQLIGLLSQAADILHQLHSRGLVHGDVCPSHLLWSTIHQQLWLIDFKTCWQKNNPNNPVSNNPTNLRYMAPEMSGRTNRSVDHRADLYSLGAIAWHLLARRPPFQELSDPLALVHAQFALDPEPLHRQDSSIPTAISELVCTLLNKDPDNRYQSASGLKVDLKQLYEQPDKPIELRRSDWSSDFIAVQQLYGRHNERKHLKSIFEHVCQGGSARTWVCGEAGIGKSSLVNELGRTVLENGGLFGSARCDQLKGEEPHHALAEAIGQVLQPSILLLELSNQIRLASSPHLPLLVTLVPELSPLLETNSSLGSVGPQEARHRIQVAFASLIRGLASRGRPLVLFLDDLQWADETSLELLDFLAAEPDLEGLFLIQGSRENRDGIQLGPLELDAICHWTADSFRCQPGQALPLAKVLLQKTGGNPFFIRTLWFRLSRERLLYRANDGSDSWQWNEQAIRNIDTSPNLLDTMLQQIQQLPSNTQTCLTAAACYGRTFAASELAQLLSGTVQTILNDLSPAVDHLLIEPLGRQSFQFAHDRVQEAAYAQLEPTLRSQYHLLLGRFKVEQLVSNPCGPTLFDAIDHLRLSIAIMTDPNERRQFAELCLRAIQRARSTGSFDRAFSLAETALEALGADRWTSDYALTHSLSCESAQGALILGQREQLENRLNEISSKAQSFADQITVWTMRLRVLMNDGQMKEAYEHSDQFLRQVGRAQPRYQSKAQVALALLKTRWKIGLRQPEELISLPETTDPVLVGIQEIQTLAALAQGRVFPETIPLGILRDVRTVLQDGMTAYGAQCWTGYGLILCNALGQVELAQRYFKLALDQVEGMGRSDAWPRIAVLGYLLISPWSQPTALVAQRCQEVSLRGFEVGDILTGCYAAIFGHHLEFHSGHELSNLAKRLERTARRRGQHRFAAAHSEQRLLHSMLNALLGRGPTQEKLLENDFQDNPYLQLGSLVLEIQKALIFNQTRRSFDIATTANRELQANPSMSTLHLLYWTYAAVAQLRGLEEGWIHWQKLKPFLGTARKVLKKWIKHLPERQWRLDWIEASMHRAQGRWEKALTNYSQSIEGALGSGHVHDAALICEHASECSRLAGKPWACQIFFDEALRYYRRWGATAKVSQLQPNQESRSVAQLSLELQTLTRASQVLSQQIHLDELTKALLRLAMENAGAQHGRLVLYQGDCWKIQATASAEELQLLEPAAALDLEQTLVPLSLVKECTHRREPVLLDDAQTSRFSADPYFSSTKTRSVICLPLQSNQRLAGSGSIQETTRWTVRHSAAPGSPP